MKDANLSKFDEANAATVDFYFFFQIQYFSPQPSNQLIHLLFEYLLSRCQMVLLFFFSSAKILVLFMCGMHKRFQSKTERQLYKSIDRRDRERAIKTEKAEKNATRDEITQKTKQCIGPFKMVNTCLLLIIYIKRQCARALNRKSKMILHKNKEKKCSYRSAYTTTRTNDSDVNERKRERET